MEGWIKLHRKLLEWDWYDDANTKSMFLHLLLKANLKDKKWRGIEIKRGQLHTSLSHLSIELGMSVKQVRICIEKLQKTNEIKTEGASNGTKITVCKYDTYQQNENEEGQTRGQERGKRGANEGQQHKKDKKDNNNKKEEEKKFIPPSLDEVIEYFLENGYVKEAAKKMFNYYSALDWKDSKDNLIKNWKLKASNVWFKPENEKRKPGLVM